MNDLSSYFIYFFSNFVKNLIRIPTFPGMTYESNPA